jgi:hypothetical protein
MRLVVPEQTKLADTSVLFQPAALGEGLTIAVIVGGLGLGTYPVHPFMSTKMPTSSAAKAILLMGCASLQVAVDSESCTSPGNVERSYLDLGLARSPLGVLRPIRELLFGETTDGLRGNTHRPRSASVTSRKTNGFFNSTRHKESVSTVTSSCPHKQFSFAVNSREVLPAQTVDATLAWSLLVGVWKVTGQVGHSTETRWKLNLA